MFCRIYDLDRRSSEEFVGEMIDYKPMLGEVVEKWLPLERAEFAQAVALLPRFDAYVTDGNVLFSQGRFGVLWRQLFEQRTAGRTLIISSFHASNFVSFCEKALIVDDGAIWIEDGLEDAMTRYPPRPPAPETTGRRDDAAGDGEADDAEPY
jgi:capsular polysaccharide transport system ATP-binding protein